MVKDNKFNHIAQKKEEQLKAALLKKLFIRDHYLTTMRCTEKAFPVVTFRK